MTAKKIAEEEKKEHAKLSPSGASRWMACPPSVSLEENFADESSSYADEGTLAHAIGALLIESWLKDEDRSEELEGLKKSPLYQPEMMDYCTDYANFVIEKFEQAKEGTKDAAIFIEKQYVIKAIPDGFGTSDATIIADGELIVIDLKYGKGVEVSSEDNKQMKCYGLGALDNFEFLYDIDRLNLIIYQPRLGNISGFSITVSDLRDWEENELKPKAALAFAGGGEFETGSHCKFCKAKPLCRKLAEKANELAKYDFKNVNLLDDDEVSDVLSKESIVSDWLSSVSEYALKRAIEGKIWPGYKLVAGRSNRVFTDVKSVENELIGYDYTEEQIFKEPELLPMSRLEKLLGKKVFDALLSPFLTKPQGKPALVPESDKRPLYVAKLSAEEDFKDLVD